ncbi:hypothetical protein ACQR1H_31210 [Bradyrhizobium sp. HKCCYLRH2015]|uniref:hypothetical protein n=1 Tax=Bradyrhizobium TaxID=374 RepID=UPI003EBBC73D
MANGGTSRTEGWRAHAFRTAGLGFLIVQLALIPGSRSAAAQPTVSNYADLPELPGPFSELEDMPPSLKQAPIMKTPTGDLVVLPTTLRLYPDESGLHLEYNLLSAAGAMPGPPARLELFVQTTVDHLASILADVAKAYPLAKVGRPKLTRPITAELGVAGPFSNGHRESILALGLDFSVSDIAFVTFEPTQLFMRLPFNDGPDLLFVRVAYEIPYGNGGKQYAIATSFSPNCRTSPGSFLDLMYARYGCPDAESWKFASPNSLLNELVADCVAKADVPSSMPEAVLSRLKEWRRKNCVITLFSGRRPG